MIDDQKNKDTVVVAWKSVVESQLITFQGIYFAIFVFILVMDVVKSWSYSRTTLAASTRLHNQVFRSVLSCPMSFFDTTPTGRILNRYF